MANLFVSVQSMRIRKGDKKEFQVTREDEN